MKKRIAFSITLFILVTMMSMLCMVACSKNKTEATLQAISTDATRIDGNIYSATISLGTDSFISDDKANLSLYIYNEDETEKVVEISDYSVELVDDSLNLTYKNDFAMNETQGVVLTASKEAVNSYTPIKCYVNQPVLEYYLSTDNTELNYYEKSFNILITLENAKLVEKLEKDYVITEGMLKDANYMVVRESDNTFSVSFSDAYKNEGYTSGIGSIKLSSDAIVGSKTTCPEIAFSIFKSNLWINTDATQIVNTSTGKQMIVPVIGDNDAFANVTCQSFSVSPSSFTIEDVDHVDANVVLVKMATTLEGIKLAEDIADLKLTLKGADGNFGGADYDVTADFASNITARGYNGEQNGDIIGYTIYCYPYNAEFNDDIEESISLVDNEGNNVEFIVTESNSDYFVLSVPSTSTELRLNLIIDESGVDAHIYHEGGYEAVINLSNDETNRFALEAFLIDKGKSILKGILGKIEGKAKSKLSSFLTPKIYELLGIEQKKSIGISDIMNKVKDVIKGIDELKMSVDDLRNSTLKAIDTTKYELLLSSFDTTASLIKTFIIGVYDAKNGYAKLLSLESAITVNGEIDEAQLDALMATEEYKNAEAVFVDAFEKCSKTIDDGQILAFGRALITNIGSLSDGYMGAFWSLMKNYYVFDVQAINQMDRFYASAVVPYLIGMNMVLRYYQALNKDLSIENWVESLEYVNDGKSSTANEAVHHGLSYYNDWIEDGKERMRNAKTLDYVTNKIVSLNMSTTPSVSNTYSFLCEPISYNLYGDGTYTAEQWTALLEYCKVRNINLWDCMADAGFVAFENVKSEVMDLNENQSKAVGVAINYVKTSQRVAHRGYGDIGPVNEYYFYNLNYVAVTAKKIKNMDGSYSVEWTSVITSGLQTKISSLFLVKQKKRVATRSQYKFKDSIGNEILMYQIVG